MARLKEVNMPTPTPKIYARKGASWHFVKIKIVSRKPDSNGAF
jgi:hypothetical protein